MLSSLFYQFIKIINKFKPVKVHINTDTTLTRAEKDEKYFWYEEKKGPSFDQRFNFSLEGKVVLEIGTGFGGYAYHALKSKASFFYGIDINEDHIRINKQLLGKYYAGNNYEMIASSAVQLDGIKDESIDMIVSDAVIEHILEREKMFSELKRVLKPGGHAYIATSPIWKTRNGAHIMRFIPIPWGHLFLSQKLLLKTLERQKKEIAFPVDALSNIILVYTTIGKLTLKKLKKEINKSGFQLVSLKNYSESTIKKILIKIPGLEEYFAGNIRIHLKKN